MPFALLIVGTVLVIAAARNTQSQLFTLVEGDFTGSGNFIYWVTAILIIGAVGYIEKLKGLSDAFLALVILVLFLTKGNPSKGIGGGFFSQFTQQLSTTQTATPSATGGTTSTLTVPSLSSTLTGTTPMDDFTLPTFSGTSPMGESNSGTEPMDTFDPMQEITI